MERDAPKAADMLEGIDECYSLFATSGEKPVMMTKSMKQNYK